MSKMYNTLKQLKKCVKEESWIKMVEQAKNKNKITEEEYQELITLEEEE